MTPEHPGTTATKCSNDDFVIQPAKLNYQPGETILVTVLGKTNSDQFKGVLLIAYDMNNDKNVVGTWTSNDTNVKTIACGHKNVKHE
ncbi:unnamed protein product [Didymodactylos carnosus]|uniref:Reelin domain-containing protein n=1 Tax=Didymodactylos carnosus TaxID=1234261 RepID=A0A8S2CQ95_9BILA|nr:unnamed protein product [Didymodactylos carnosus]CAF3530868.1 unnamed protein product [Didymodactylos carnosus]